MTQGNSPRSAAPVAIVGVSTLFPGASNAAEFWRNIVYGRDLITDIPETHWKLEDHYDPDPMAEDKTYARRAGFVPDTAFSPIEFGLPPSQLDVTDILQLLSLTVAKQVIDDAGFSKEKPLPTERTGAIFGITGANSLTQPLSNRLQGPVWRKVLESRGFSDPEINDLIETMKKAYAPWEENSFPGMLGNVVSGRVANRFDLGGTNCTIDAACASSLAAMRMAIDELQTGRADMMLTGGCDAENTILMFMCFSKTPAFSRKGSITPFDVEADGTLIGEGIGMMMLKRLEDAERDGDRVYAVIKGLGSSSDGRFKSIYAPRDAGQVKALTRAYDEAGISPARVGLIEAHGTGTAVGDATEANGLKLMFEATGTLATEKRTALGSVKSQIGHTKAAAGAASAIKTALALHQRVLPPTINVKKPDPKLGLDATPLYINNTARPWFSPKGEKRVAGVSSFGFGGTNFHLVLEEAENAQADHRFDTLPRPIVVAAATPAELSERCQALAAATGPDAWPYEVNAPADHARVAFVALDDAQRAERLTLAADLATKTGEGAARHPKGITYRRSAIRGKVAALFAGQGAQHPDMGRTAMLAMPEMRRFVEEFDPLFTGFGDEALSSVMYPVPAFDPNEAKVQSKAIRRTRYAQTAVGALAAGQFEMYKKAGLTCDMAGGHSFGELTALWASGAMRDSSFVRLAKLRGEAMTPPDVDGFDPGTMSAVSAGESQTSALISESGTEVQICNINTPTQTVVGGSMFAISSFEKFLEEKKVAYTRLPVSGAFHTPRVAHAITAFSKGVEAEELSAPSIPVYANRDGAPYSNDVAPQLKAQLSEPVRFVAMIESMYTAGARVFVEFGPKNALSRMVGKILGDREHISIALDNGDPAQAGQRLIEAAAELAAAGVAIADPVAGRLPVEMPAVPKKGTVMLTGVNHVSEARRNAYQTALDNPPAPTPRAIEGAATIPASAPIAPAPQIDSGAMLAELTESMNAAFARFMDGKRSELEAMLGGQVSAPASLASAPVQPAAPLAAPVEAAPAPATHSHAPGLNGSAALLTGAAAAAEAQPAAPAAGTAASAEVEGLLLSIVAEKTGYPEDVLDMTMDMEADLGIDSIKRVEILGALGEKQSGMAEPDPETLGNLRTLADVAALAGGVVAANAPAPATVVEAAPAQVQSAPAAPAPVVAPAAAPAAAADNDAVQGLLLSIVAEKTGYPEDVLDMTMDMEADLGIDSIKRVEILGALGEKQPGMAEPDPETLGNLRTLADVAALAGGVVAANAPNAAAPVAEPAPAPVQVAAPAPIAAPIEAPAPDPATTAPSADGDAVQALLLSIVAEKTGYPEDVLELDMDMEADLGIDSIKRVEILGALGEKQPGMAEPDPETLGNLRTLADVAALAGGIAATAPTAAPMAAAIPTTAAPSAPQPAAPRAAPFSTPLPPKPAIMPTAPAAANPVGAVSLSEPAPSNEAVETLLLSIVAEKTGYPEDVLELDMDMEADLGIDSIKRVEILGALGEKQAGMAEPDPETLGNLRTLRDVAALASGFAAEAADLPGKSQAAPDLALASSQSSASVTQLQTQAAPKPAPVIAEGVGRADIRVVPAPARLSSDAALGHLVIAGDQKVGVALASLLAERGDSAEVIADLASARTRIAAGNADGVVLLRPAFDDNLPASADSAGAVFAAQALLLAGVTKTALSSKGEAGHFLAATRMDGMLGYGATTDDVSAAALAGLLKTYAAESAENWTRHVDLSPTLQSSQVAQELLAELTDADRDTREIGIAANGVRSAVTVVPTAASLTGGAEAGETFLVTGGARGVTSLCVKALAAEGSKRFVLVGRSPLAEADPAWAGGIDDDSALKKAAAAHFVATGEKPTPRAIGSAVNAVVAGREIRALLAELTSLGSQAEYCAADLADAAARARLAAHPMIAEAASLSVVHGAGALADAMLERKTEAEMQRVFAPKIYGLSGLLSVLDAQKIKRLWVFSSVAGLFGNIGQSDYAMANETLNRLAARWTKQGVDARALNWGAWDAGMVDDKVRAIFKERGVHLIPADSGAALFAQEFRQDAPSHGVAMIGDMKPLSSAAASAGQLERAHSLSLDWAAELSADVILDHRIHGRPVLPATFALGLIGRECERLLPGWMLQSASRFTILNGVGADDNGPKRFKLNLTPSGEARFDIKVIDEHGRPRFALDGASLVKTAPTRGASHSAAAFGPEQDASGFYADSVLFHGPSLQLLKSYSSDDGADRLSFELAPLATKAPGESALFEPVLADAMLQAALAATFLRSKLPSLPMKLDNLEFCSKPEPGAPIKVDLAFDAETGTNTSWRIQSHQNGLPLASLTATTIKSAALTQGFAISAE